MSYIYHTFFYQPLYKGLVFLVALVPGHNIGWAIIILTIVVRLVLLPLSYASIRTQAKMKQLESRINEIKEKYKNNKEEQARATMTLYKTEKINPFSSILLLLIQLPIIIALYRVFLVGVNFGSSGLFLGFFNMAQHSYILAIIAGVSQFFQAQLMTPTIPKKDKNKTASFKDDLARSMSMQMKYFLPVFIIIIATRLPSAVVLYWVTSNLFMIAQEFLFKRKRERAT